MDCGTPLLLMGLLAPPDVGDDVRYGPPDAKGQLGDDWGEVHLTENFAVHYPGTVTLELAELTGVLLEQSWAALVEQEGWRQPPLSESFLVRVELHPQLDYSGYTAMATGPEGDFPLIQIRSTYSSSPDFYASLVAHEFAHAVQFAYRPNYRASDDEPWYWEASAEWSAERAMPERDAYAQQVVYYADRPELRYSSMQGGHPYGMSVVNAALEEHLDTTMRSVWEHGADTPQRTWDEVLRDATGLAPAGVWGTFTGAFGNNQLRESDLYADAIDEPLEIGVSSQLEYLGTHYYRATAPETLTAVGDVVLSGPDGYGDTITLQEGQVLAVTGLDPDVAVYAIQGDVKRQPKGCGHTPLAVLWLSPVLLLRLRAGRRRRSGCSSR